LRIKQIQCTDLQNELQYSLGPRFEEQILNEKHKWEQEQNFLIRRELSKLSEEKNKEITRIQEELLSERDKNIKERERIIQIEKQVEDLKQDLKMANTEKTSAIAKARDSLRVEAEKIKEDILNDKFEEINRFKRVIKELESEIEQFKIELYEHSERDNELIRAVENQEKGLIKDLNDEQRRLASLIPGLVPKILNISNVRTVFASKNFESALSLAAFQSAFMNFRSLIDELAQNVQGLKLENDQLRRNIQAMNQEKGESIETVKRQYERQKQRDLEAIREYMTKDQVNVSNCTNEVSSLVIALKNKDKEIHEIQDNMTRWKQDTLEKLAEKFESELTKELDRRMHEYKIDSSNQQMQLDKIRKEMDSLIKEYRDAAHNLINKDAHERMISYYKSRMEDLRNENISLRQRIKTSNYMQQQMNMLNASKSVLNQDDLPPLVGLNDSINGADFNVNVDDDACGGVLYSPSVDGEEHLLNKNEMLQQRLNELEKLQLQLSNPQM